MWYALLAAMMAVASPAVTAPALETKLTGGFIQYWNSYTTDSGTALSAQQWKDVVRAMKKAQMDTIVLQHVAWEDFLLYMDPVHEDKAYEGARKADRKKLYDSYLAALSP